MELNRNSLSDMSRAEEVANLLAENNGFLPPAIKGRDGHFLNSIHILQYIDKLKLPGFDQHCSSISPELYSQKSGNRAIMDDCLPNYSPNKRKMLDVLILCLSDSE
ncbi:23308_t:CDS:2 [Gigaspora margarita]|uniref:23308_t:CDS:1 n=1 Tax=Gigaspora margarita TaxID=4874 RepID=A0ABN7V9J2_GIGMA|nr:23308_t:CDS:2 [Gigaspora margarita]